MENLDPRNDSWTAEPIMQMEAGKAAMANPVAAVEQVAKVGQVDMSMADKVETEFARADRLSRFQEKAGVDIVVNESLKSSAEEVVGKMEVEAKAMREAVEAAEAELAQAREELARVQLEKVQKESQKDFMKLSVAMGSQKLETRWQAIDDDVQQKWAELTLEDAGRRMATSNRHREQYEPKLAEARVLLDEYRTTLEAANGIGEDMRRRLEAMGMGNAVLEGDKIVEGAVKGTGVESARIQNITEKMRGEVKANEELFESRWEEIKTEGEQKKKEAEAAVQAETEGFGEKITAVQAEIDKLGEKEEAARSKVAEKEARLAEANERRGAHQEAVRGVDRVIVDLENRIAKDRDLLARAAEKMAQVELRGAEALKGLRIVSEVIEMSEFSVEVASDNAKNALEGAMAEWIEEIDENASERIHRVGEQRELKIEDITKGVMEANEDLMIDENGDIKVKDLKGWAAVDAISEAYEPIKAGVRKIREWARVEVRQINDDRKKKTVEVRGAMKAGQEKIDQSAREAREKLAAMATTVNFLKEEAQDRFGNVVEEQGQSTFMERAKKAVKGLFSGLFGRRDG